MEFLWLNRMDLFSSAVLLRGHESRVFVTCSVFIHPETFRKESRTLIYGPELYGLASPTLPPSFCPSVPNVQRESDATPLKAEGIDRVVLKIFSNIHLKILSWFFSTFLLTRPVPQEAQRWLWVYVVMMTQTWRTHWCRPLFVSRSSTTETAPFKTFTCLLREHLRQWPAIYGPHPAAWSSRRHFAFVIVRNDRKEDKQNIWRIF